jgi:hypothetical protein
MGIILSFCSPFSLKFQRYVQPCVSQFDHPTSPISLHWCIFACQKHQYQMPHTLFGKTGMYPPKTFTWPYKYLHNIQWYQARNQGKITEYLNIGYIAPKNLCGPSQHPYGPSLVVDHHFTAVIMIGLIFSHQIL